jgi:hypothetical protein
MMGVASHAKHRAAAGGEVDPLRVLRAEAREVHLRGEGRVLIFILVFLAHVHIALHVLTYHAYKHRNGPYVY